MQVAGEKLIDLSEVIIRKQGIRDTRCRMPEPKLRNLNEGSKIWTDYGLGRFAFRLLFNKNFSYF